MAGRIGWVEVSIVTRKSIDSVLQSSSAAIMGIINITPDSFSDGGGAFSVKAACEQGLRMIDQGANILDVGGESTRPGAEPVSLAQELDRVIPVIEQLKSVTDVPISIDTYKVEVMREAVNAGAQMINDVNALRAPEALTAAAILNVPVCLMHMRGDPANMQNAPAYDSVVMEVIAFLNQRIEACIAAGMSANNLLVDPGIGFGKTLEHNLVLLSAIPELLRLKAQVLIGVSRKSMIDQLLDRTVDERVAASVGLAVQSVMNGAKIVRVHDVLQTHDAVRAVEAVIRSKRTTNTNRNYFYE